MKRLLILSLLVIAACRKEAPKPVDASVTIGPESVAVARQERVEAGPLLSGTLEPRDQATILAESSGTVTAVYAAEGQRVSPGMLLARLHDPTAETTVVSAQTSVQSAQTTVAMASRDLERARMLSSAGAVPKRDVDVGRTQLSSAQAQLAQARSQLTIAQEQLSHQVVRASSSGTVSRKHISDGDLVTPGAQLFTIVDLSTLQLEASVPADALAALSIGDVVRFEVRGNSGQPFTGRISRIAPTVDAATGQVRVYVTIANEKSTLVGGLFAEGTVTTVSRNAIVLPIAAIDETGGVVTVTRLRSGVTEKLPVKVGIRNERSGKAEIVGGVNAGDQVLTGPARTITPGTRVTVGNVTQAATER